MRQSGGRSGSRRSRDGPANALWIACAGAGTACHVFRMRESIKTRIVHRLASEVGDVPGWVLITLMTAGLVILIWALAGPALSEIFQNAIAKVTGL